MKIPGSDGNENQVKKLLEDQSIDKVTGRAAQALKKQSLSSDASSDPNQTDEDKLNVSSLAKLLRTELDPQKLAEERRQKLEDINKRIKDGTYSPPLEQVAKSLSQELSIEILLGGEKSEGEIL